MNVLDLYQSDGHHAKREASTGGGTGADDAQAAAARTASGYSRTTQGSTITRAAGGHAINATLNGPMAPAT